MNKFFKCSLSLLIILIGGFYSKQLVFGEELKGTDIVDILEINDTNLSQGQMTSVKVTFNEKHKNHIKPGDTLTLLIPPGLEGMTENDGSPRKIFLGNLGEVLIYKDKVIATFNDSVKILDHVHGSFSFGIKSALTNNTKDTTIETNFGTNLQKQSITVQGVSDNQEVDTPPFFYKSGDLLGDSDKVRWFLNANLNKEELSDDIVISDTHGAGQILNKDSFSITVNNYLGSNSYDLNDFIKKGFGTIQFTTYNTFVIRLNKEHARLASFSIMYTTTITLEGQKQDVFENSYELNYHLRDKNPVSENNSTNVKNVFADGDADGDIDKDDTNDSVDPLPHDENKPEMPLTENTDDTNDSVAPLPHDENKPEMPLTENTDDTNDSVAPLPHDENKPEMPLTENTDDTNDSVAPLPHDENKPEMPLTENTDDTNDSVDPLPHDENKPEMPLTENTDDTNDSVDPLPHDENKPEMPLTENTDDTNDSVAPLPHDENKPEMPLTENTDDTNDSVDPLQHDENKPEMPLIENTDDTNDSVAPFKYTAVTAQSSLIDLSRTPILTTVRNKDKQTLPMTGSKDDIILVILGCFFTMFTTLPILYKHKNIEL